MSLLLLLHGTHCKKGPDFISCLFLNSIFRTLCLLYTNYSLFSLHDLHFNLSLCNKFFYFMHIINSKWGVYALVKINLLDFMAG